MFINKECDEIDIDELHKRLREVDFSNAKRVFEVPILAKYQTNRRKYMATQTPPQEFQGLLFKLPTLDDKTAVLAFKHAYLSHYADTTIHGSSELHRFDEHNFDAWLDYVYAPVGTNLFGYAKIASDTFLIYQNNVVVGFLNVRYELTNNLLKVGGHIGYSTHPDFQGQGVASGATAYACQLLKEKGVDKVLITCNDDNIGSARVIEKNGGVLENVLATTGGNYRRYWIAV